MGRAVSVCSKGGRCGEAKQGRLGSAAGGETVRVCRSVERGNPCEPRSAAQIPPPLFPDLCPALKRPRARGPGRGQAGRGAVRSRGGARAVLGTPRAARGSAAVPMAIPEAAASRPEGGWQEVSAPGRPFPSALLVGRVRVL